MQPLYNIQDSKGHTIWFTRDREMIINTLQSMHREWIKHLSIVEDYGYPARRYTAVEWLRLQIAKTPRNFRKYIKRLIKKHRANKEFKNDLATLLAISRRTY